MSVSNDIIWSKYSKLNKNFIEHVSTHLEYYGGKLIFLKGKSVGALRALGEFLADNENPVIKLAGKYEEKEVIAVLAHEYAHFHQYEEEAKCWNNFENLDNSWPQIFKTSRLNDIQRNYINTIIKVELDAEKRAIGIIKQNKLKLNEKEYIQKSNYILYKWIFLKNFGQWPTINQKQQEFLVKLAPDKFITRYDKIPQEILLGFSKFLSKKRIAD